MQVVDGLWSVISGGLRTAATGYDRLVAIGDTTWKDYEVVVPITIHSFDTAGYGPINFLPTVGIFVGWTGHTDNPVAGWQPKAGYKPFGCAGLYEFAQSGFHLSIYDKIDDTGGKQVIFGVPTYFKMQVLSTVSGVLYSFKVWEVGQSEPSAYDLTWQGPLRDPQQGAILLQAHFVDATFGKVSVTPITTDHVPPAISGLAASSGQTTAQIDWQTDESARGRCEYGLTSGYGTVLANATLKTNHSYVLNGLSKYTTYHYRVYAFDAAGNASSSGDQTFTTTGNSTLVSDEFNVQPIDSSLWTVQDPVGDVSISVSGGNLTMALPQSVAHTVTGGGNTMPRILQPAADADFDVQVKLAASFSQPVGGGGIIVDGSASDYLRFELYSDGSSIRAFGGAVTANTPATLFDVPIAANGTAPLYLRLKRERSTWTESYSLNGTTWTAAGRFDYTLDIHHIGLTSRNEGTPPPGITSFFDYFRAALPPLPRLKSPANGASGVGTTMSLAWYSSFGALRYHVQVATDPAFTTGFAVNDSSVTDTIRVLTGLTPYTQYYWRVASANAGGKGPFSVSRRFFTQLPLPNLVTLVSPANLAKVKADSVLCVWRKNPQAGSKYWIEVSDDSLFMFPDLDSSLTDTTKMLRNLTLNQWHYWRVRAGNLSGWGPFSEMRRFYASLTAVSGEQTLPREVTLAQNYPNPFNPATAVEYGLPSASHVLLEVFNTLGQRVALLVNGQQEAGNHRLLFAADGLSSGVYFYRLSVNAGEHVFVRRMTLIR